MKLQCCGRTSVYTTPHTVQRTRRQRMRSFNGHQASSPSCLNVHKVAQKRLRLANLKLAGRVSRQLSESGKQLRICRKLGCVLRMTSCFAVPLSQYPKWEHVQCKGTIAAIARLFLLEVGRISSGLRAKFPRNVYPTTLTR